MNSGIGEYKTLTSVLFPWPVLSLGGYKLRDILTRDASPPVEGEEKNTREQKSRGEELLFLSSLLLSLLSASPDSASWETSLA